MKKLALFDLDGTLFDTCLVNYNAYNDALKEYGFKIDKNYFLKYCNGRDYKKFIPQIVNNDELITESVHDLKKEKYFSYLNMAIINNHLFSIIEKLKTNYYLVICTTASKKNAIEILEFFDKKNLFDSILTRDDCVKVKPDPEIFENAMKKYNIMPEDTLIFEDSEVGIEAARKTGATVFIVDQFNGGNV